MDLRRTSWGVAAVTLLGAGTGSAVRLGGWLVLQDRLPLADMAKNAWLGWRLASSVARGDLFEFALRLNEHSTWPFGYSMLLVPGFLACGQSLTAAAISNLVLFALVPLAILGLARSVDRGSGAMAAGAIGGTIFLASPLASALSILVLRETAGVLLMVLALTAYLRAIERPTLARWRLAAASLCFVFFVKYNYFLLIAPALAIDGWLRLPAERRRSLIESLGLAARQALSWRRHQFWIAISVVVLLGSSVGAGNPGTVLFAIVLAWTIAAIVRAISTRSLGFLRPSSLPTPLRATVECLVIPIWLWCLGPSPMHTRGLLEFLVNRKSGLAVASGVRVSWESFATEIAPSPFLAVVVLALAVMAPFVGGASPRLRFLGLGALSTALLPLLHPYKEPRFLVTALPLIALLAGFGVVQILDRIGRSARLPALGAIGGSFVALGLAISLEIPPLRFVETAYVASSSPSSTRAALGALSEVAPLEGRVALLGTYNGLSRELVLWTLERRDGSKVRAIGMPSRARVLDSESSARRAIDAWLTRETPDSIIVVEPGPGSSLVEDSDYKTYTSWQLDVANRLLDRTGWRVQERRDLEDPAVRVSVLVPSAVGVGREDGAPSRELAPQFRGFDAKVPADEER